MKDTSTKKRWDAFAKYYKWNTGGAERRWAPWKKHFFSRMGEGKILFLAVGVGSEFKHFPVDRDLTGIDISSEMLKKAADEATNYQGKIELKEMDARELMFSNDTFDQVFTSCTFCSVRDPVKGLKELNRVLKPGGELNMFEHTRSMHFPFKQMLHIMNPLAQILGPSMIRDTVGNVQKACFKVNHVYNIYLDVLKTIYAAKPDSATSSLSS